MKEVAPAQRSGRLLAGLTAALYALFTLLPDSSSLMVAWPWVFLWQVGLLCPILWLLWQTWRQQRFPKLGNGLDWLMGWMGLSLVLSAVFAEFPAQARWYSWAAIGLIAALYALSDRLRFPEERYSLLVKQGYLNLAFILISLSLWTTQTLLPELARLRQLRQLGADIRFDFSVLELRNWAPIGHQNYVAGYLLLALPLLLGLAILQSGWRRWLWVAGVGLGLVNLYTTSSRGGWLGLVVMAIAGLGILLLRSALPRRWLWGGGVGMLVAIALFVLANNRLRIVISGLLQGQGSGELAFRIITHATGWQMGLSHLWTGVGLGGVPLLYQRYRPVWAGQEAELVYQLHGTPIQIWAELGLLGLVGMIGAIALFLYFIYRWFSNSPASSTDDVLTGSLLTGLLAYGVISLTDYQLDIIGISGTLVIYTAVLASINRDPAVLTGQTERHEAKTSLRSPASLIALAGAGVTLAMTLWLVPVHRAWQLSSQGFLALNPPDPNLEFFTQSLARSHQLAPWEPYYPYQLGWNLGDLALKATSPEQQTALIQESIDWFEIGNQISPYQEFGHSNLGWLLLNQDPAAAAQEFARSAELVPAKRGVFYGLAVSLLAQGNLELAAEAAALEILRDPLFITSPIWNQPELRPLYVQTIETLEEKYTVLLQEHPELSSYWHQSRGAIRWWRGDFAAAHADWDDYGTPTSQTLLALSEGKDVTADLQALPDSPEKLAMLAWLNPSERTELLQQAWIAANQTEPIAEIQQALELGMQNSTDFDQWLRENALTRQYRRERAGFNVLSRHMDGPAPSDFLVVTENIPAAQFFDTLFSTTIYNPELDLALQSLRTDLLQTLPSR